MNDRVAGLLKSREAPASVTKGPNDGTGRDVDRVPAEAVIAVSGHESSADDEFDGFHFFGFLLSLMFMKFLGGGCEGVRHFEVDCSTKNC